MYNTVSVTLASTIQHIKSANINIWKTNAEERRYVNTYLYERSYLSPFLKMIGITKPSQLGKAYFRMSSIKFVKLVIWSAYLNLFRYKSYTSDFIDPQGIFKYYDMEVAYKAVASNYYNLRDNFRKAQALCMWENKVTINGKFKILNKAVRAVIDKEIEQPLTIRRLKAIPDRYPGLTALETYVALIVTKTENLPASRVFIKANYADIMHDLYNAYCAKNINKFLQIALCDNALSFRDLTYREIRYKNLMFSPSKDKCGRFLKGLGLTELPKREKKLDDAQLYNDVCVAMRHFRYIAPSYAVVSKLAKAYDPNHHEHAVFDEKHSHKRYQLECARATLETRIHALTDSMNGVEDTEDIEQEINELWNEVKEYLRKENEITKIIDEETKPLSMEEGLKKYWGKYGYDMLEQGANISSSSLDAKDIPKEIVSLAHKLAAIHGPVNVTSESSGIHIYIADPELLRTDGTKELQSKHLAVNADKYLGLGDYNIDLCPTPANRELYNTFRRVGKEIPCAQSMKTGKVYMVSELLKYKPIQDRDDLFKHVVVNVALGSTNKRLVRDEYGKMVPEWCGDVIPITSLHPKHPAAEYLLNRGYNLSMLEAQFEVCYCKQALPESRAEGRYYSKLPGGMMNTPQGRIIFSARMEGSRLGFQSRFIEKWVDNKLYFWSHNEQWVLIKERLPDGTLVDVFSPTERFPKGFSPHKYMNASGSERNKLLMGFDAAVAFNASRPKGSRYCILVEGPLDAARAGPPALAILGKSLSIYQADLIKKNFDKIVTVMDNDAAGLQCIEKIRKHLGMLPISEVHLPDGTKDLGELDFIAALDLLKTHIPRC